MLSLRLFLKGNKGVLEKQGAGLQEKDRLVLLYTFRFPSYHPRKSRTRHLPQERRGHYLDPQAWLYTAAHSPLHPHILGKGGSSKELGGRQ